MVGAPKCKVCQAHHWGNEPHVFAGPKKAIHVDGVGRVTDVPKLRAYAAALAPKAAAETERIAALEAEIAALKAAKAPKRDRAAYMRAYRASKR